MIRIYQAGIKDIDELMELRKAMLREVNSLPEEHTFGKAFNRDSKRFFLSGNQTTFIAAEDKAIACATICYYDVLPTFAHPGGKRAHIMNVYTSKEYRRQGIASTLLYMLTDQAKERGITEITLDSVPDTKSIYYKSGFTDSDERMVMDIPRLLRLNIERAERTGCGNGNANCVCSNNKE